MLYSGKYTDLFEYAMQILFVKKGYGIIPHLDVMGKRCFAFQNRSEEKGYYIPIVDTEKAVKEIAGYMHLEEELAVWRPETAGEFMECVSEGIVYGPIEKEVAVRRVKNLYYNGENRYVYIQAELGSKYCITDPDGFAVLYYSEDEVRSLFCRGKGVVIRLSENDGIDRQVRDAKIVWRDGQAFHRMMAGHVQGSTLCEDAFQGYDGSASSEIALWCGVTNYLQYMEKIWSFQSESGLRRNNRESNFRRQQCEMLKIAECGEIAKLPSAEAAIWKEVLDEI